jgi:hypothetical protein
VPLTIRGVEGAVRWSYRLAASLGAWTVTKPDDGGPYTLTAAILKPNTFALSQRPLMFVVATQGGSWRWPILELQVVGTSLSGTLGPKEKS